MPEAGGFDSSRPDSNAPLPDAGQPDADADLPPLPVTVLVTSMTGTVISNATVIFHDASGAVLETKKTGADGKAMSAPTPAPAMATVVFGEGSSQRELLTWTGVQGGDVLPVVAPHDYTLAEVQITIPGQFAGGADAGPTANYYAQVGGCDAYSTTPNEPMTIYLNPYCYRGAGAVLVTGSDSNDFIVAHSLKKPVTLATDGGVVAVTTDAWSSPPTDVTVSLTNIANPRWVWFQQVANQTAFPRRTEPMGADVSFRAAPGSFVDAYNAAVVLESSQLHRTIGKRVAPAATITLDGSQLPPELTDATVDSTIGKRPKFDWTGNMGAMKGGVVRVTWSDSSKETSTTWSIVVPANNAASGSVTAPALPASLDDVLPVADGGSSTWDTTPEVIFVDSDLLPDYAAWRKTQGAILPLFMIQAGRVEEAVLPQNGSFRISHWTLPLQL